MSGRTIMLIGALAALQAALGPGSQAGEKGPGFQWPAFQDIRYREDWSVLAERPADAPRDFFDPIKYVPLGADGFPWASFGGQVRERYEMWNDFAFGGKGPRDDHYLQSRFRLHGDFHLTPEFRFFVEMKSAHTTDATCRRGGGRWTRTSWTSRTPFSSTASP